MEESVTLSSFLPPIILVAIIVMLVKRSRDRSFSSSDSDTESFTSESSKSAQITDELSVEDATPDKIHVSGSKGDENSTTGGVGMNFREMFRDKTRENMAQFLSGIGIKTELSDRGRPEE